ncbi:hypothetical protein [Rhodococcus sp. JVH1]|uniref:hypothetical protein n=1 Tax=Rhodococcus sp. JVH1 TaxID=745408 RepID=UPI000271EA14|nr:hypothetical protein [Rhodococcus sp. JVH1]EJI98602.1 hypothetical protein JVH1_3858 [Rhodococcus sp. JVH1]
MKVTAHAVRIGEWWTVDVPEVDGLFIPAKRLDQIPAMVADAAALLTEVAADQVEVTLDYDLGDPAVLRNIAEAKQRSAEAQRAVEKASRLSRALVHDLRARGLSVRDVATILEISHQRVAQLDKEHPTT